MSEEVEKEKEKKKEGKPNEKVDVKRRQRRSIGEGEPLIPVFPLSTLIFLLCYKQALVLELLAFSIYSTSSSSFFCLRDEN